MNNVEAPGRKTLGLCADDFGLSVGISQGIAQLVRAGRLSAVSCITNSMHWVAGASLLSDLPDSVDIGLHVNLTEGHPMSPELGRIWPDLLPLASLLLRAHAGVLPIEGLRAEVTAQLNAFRRGTGKFPAFIDGHRHVHQLPGLRSVILDLIAQLQLPAAVRDASHLPGPGFWLKRWVIANSGAHGLSDELIDRGLAHNTCLFGVYDFSELDYRGLMQAWLARLPTEGGLLFCHPGIHLKGDLPDPIGPARMREMDYLASDAFLQDLESAGVRLGRAWAVRGRGPGVIERSSAG